VQDKPEPEPDPLPQDVLQVADAVFSTFGLIFNSESSDPTAETYPTGMTVSWITENVSLSIVLSNAQTSISSPVQLSGSITITRSNASTSGYDTLTFSSSNLTVTAGSAFSNLVLDGSGDWQETPDGGLDTNSDPQNVTGTLSIDGTAYEISDILPQLYPEEGEDSAVTNIRFMTVGSDYAIVATDNGVHWEAVLQASSSTNDILWDIACNTTSKCVAVGSSGAIYYSTDQRNWAKTDSGLTDATIASVEAIGGRFLAGMEGSANILVSDDDGVTWSQKSIPTLTSIYDFASDGTKIIAAAYERQFISSDSGNTWIERYQDENGMGDIVFGSLNLNTIEYSGGHWLAAGRYKGAGGPPVVLYSADGEDWTTVSIDTFTTGTPMSIITDGAGTWMLAGHSGTDTYTTPAKVYITSTTPPTSGWTDASSGDMAPIVDAAYGDMGNGISHWALFGLHGEAFFSTDGMNWTERSSWYGTFGATYVPIAE
jgi:hypothetical protein